MAHGAWTLGEFPVQLVRVACAKCDRAGQYHTAQLIKRYGADMNMPESGGVKRFHALEPKTVALPAPGAACDQGNQRLTSTNRLSGTCGMPAMVFDQIRPVKMVTSTNREAAALLTNTRKAAIANCSAKHSRRLRSSGIMFLSPGASFA
jgi:hypothetical protein